MNSISNTILISLCLLLCVNITAKEQPKDNSLFFIENAGQITDQHHQQRKDIDYKLEVNGVTLFVGNGQLHYQWVKGQNSKVKNEKDIDLNTELGNDSISIYRMDVTLVGANKDATLIAKEVNKYYEYHYSNILIDGAKASTCNKVIYQNVYPNIDWVLYTKNGQLKYDFIVHKGGNVANIQLKYDGTTSLQLQDGALTATTPYGSITEAAPYTYNNTTAAPISSHYQLKGNILSFEVANIEQDLTIDPELSWATYIGGSNEEEAHALTTDTTGDVIVCGETFSTNIATSGAHQTTLGSQEDGYIIKFDTSGNCLWATYYGGNAQDILNDVATDISGNIFVTGYTKSTAGIATSGAYQTTNPPTQSNTITGCAFLVKLNQYGARQWGTYFGDTLIDVAEAISCDDSGYIYIGGATGNTMNIATSGSFQSSAPTNNRTFGFLSKFNTSGSLQWSSYYNGRIKDIDCYNNNVYICGLTDNSVNVSTSNGYMNYCPACTTNDRQGFFARFSSDGSRIWGSFYNGSNRFTSIYSLATAPTGDIYICGISGSSNLATPGAHKTVSTGLADAFVAKFDSGCSLKWSTYYGGSTGLETAYQMDVDPKGQIYVMGNTRSSDGINNNGHQSTLASTLDDLFLAIFCPKGQLLYGTYYGGVQNDLPISANSGALAHLCSYAKGKVYIGGYTLSSGLATAGAYRSSITGTSRDMLLAQFNVDTLMYIKQPFTDTAFCIGDTLRLKYGVLQPFRTNNTFTAQLSNNSGSFASPTNIGSINSAFDSTITCVIPNVSAGSGYKIRIISTTPADTLTTSCDELPNIHINPAPIFSASSNTPICSGDTLNLNLNTSGSTNNVVWSWTGIGGFKSGAADTIITNTTVATSGDYILSGNLFGCIRTDTITVTVNPTPVKPTLASNAPICGGDTLLLSSSTSTTGVSYAWSGPGFTATQKDPMLLNAQVANSGVYTLTLSLGMCSISDTISVQVDPAATVSVVPTPGNDICEGTQVTFVAFVNNSGTNPQYQWQKNGIDIPGANNNNYITTPANGDSYNVILSPNTTCKNDKVSNIVNMTVSPVVTPSVSISSNPTLPVGPWTMVTFKATFANGGNSPTFQWKRNGQDVVGATSDIWGTAQLNNNDVISVVLYSQHKCAVPDTAVSNAIDVLIDLGVDDITGGSLQLYPNPNSGSFTIKGEVANNKTINLTIINKLGQTVHQTTIRPQHNTINQQININKELATGVYLLQLRTEDGVSTVKLHIQ